MGTVPQRNAPRSSCSVTTNTTPMSSLSSTSFNRKVGTMITEKNTKNKKMKNPNHEKKIENRGLKGQRGWLVREFCGNKTEKRFWMQNLSQAGLGKERDEKDSFEIVDGTRKKRTVKA